MKATQIGIEILENSYLIGTKDMCSKLIMQFEQSITIYPTITSQISWKPL